MPDQTLGEVVNEVIGHNVYRQLTTIVPDFFERPYVVIQMQPDLEKKRKQRPIIPVTPLKPVVVESTVPAFYHSFTFPVDEIPETLTRVLETGSNLLVSPDVIRISHIQYSDYILREAPRDSLIIVVTDPNQGLFERGSRLIYSHGGNIGKYNRRFTEFTEEQFSLALTRGKTHFAFLPKEQYPDQRCCDILDGWELLIR
ncbi:MAG: hypothetical protein ABIH37_03365 [archaeon]